MATKEIAVGEGKEKRQVTVRFVLGHDGCGVCSSMLGMARKAAEENPDLTNIRILCRVLEGVRRAEITVFNMDSRIGYGKKPCTWTRQ